MPNTASSNELHGGYDPSAGAASPLARGRIRDGLIVEANDLFATLSGRREAELIGMDYLHLVAPEDRARIAERYRLRSRGDTVPDNYEFTLLCADGRTRRVEIFVRAVDGDVVFCLVDRTEALRRRERHAHLAALGASLQHLRDESIVVDTIFSSLADVGMVAFRLTIDEPHVRVEQTSLPAFALEEFRARTGVAVAELRGMLTASIRDAWHDGVDYNDDYPHATEDFLGGEVGAVARQLLHALGLTRAVGLRIDGARAKPWLLILAADWLAPDDTPAMQLFATQVSAALEAGFAIRELSERGEELAVLNRLAVATSDCNDAESVIQRAGEVIRANGSADAIAVFLLDESGSEARLAGMVGGSEILRERLSVVPLRGSMIGEVIRDRRPRALPRQAYTPAIRALIDDAGVREWTVISAPLLARARVLGVVQLVQCGPARIDERKIAVAGLIGSQLGVAIESALLYADLRSSYEALSRAQQKIVSTERLAALGEMSAVVAHEVRNPLAVLFNSIGSLRRMLRPVGDAATLFDAMTEEAQRLNRIVGDLLDFAKPSAPEFRETRVERVVEDVSQSMASADGSKARFRVRCDVDLQPTLCDAMQLRQAILNVVINAVQAMHGDGEVDIRLSMLTDSSPPSIVVRVRDHGPGVPAELVERVFEPFFTTKAAGTGLGLAVVRRILESHGGSVRIVAPDDGPGAVVELSLPLRSASALET